MLLHRFNHVAIANFGAHKGNFHFSQCQLETEVAHLSASDTVAAALKLMAVLSDNKQ